MLRRGLCKAAGVGPAVAMDDDVARFAGPAGYDVVALGMALEIPVYADKIAWFGRRAVARKAFCIVVPREFSLQLKPTMAY